MKPEKRSLGMHPNLLFDIILRQAGTIQKALLEGVMNAIDAGATECVITLDTKQFSISDNGRGFQSKKEIKEWFDTFGTPHVEGDAVYGRFRMGRGQLIAFGKNQWRTRQFEMEVDVKKTGLDYDLTVHNEIFDGTRVIATLYEQLSPVELERVKSELRKFVAWAQIPIILNGDVISKQPADAKWTMEDDDAYYNLSTERSMLSVYNLGVLVNDFSSGRFGVGGTIVTKKQVAVNFARNDIQSQCDIFKRIQAKIKAMTGKAAKKKTKLTDAERDMLVKDFLAGDIDVQDAAKLRALTDVNGRNWPIDKLTQIGTKFNGQLTVASRGDLMVETAQRRGICFSVDEGTLERFGVSDGQALIDRIISASKALREQNTRNYSSAWNSLYQLAYLEKDKIRVVERDTLEQFVDSSHISLSKNELNEDQKLMLHAIESANRKMITTLNLIGYEDRKFTERTISLGKSETALAWTNGLTAIWFDVEEARKLRLGYSGAYQIALTLLHEMLHTGPDTGTHSHDMHFYQSFHDISGSDLDPVGGAAKSMLKSFTSSLVLKKKKISQKLLEKSELEHKIDQVREYMENREADEAFDAT